MICGQNVGSYIHPDSLACLEFMGLDLVLQLRGKEPQHILSTTEKPLAGCIVDVGLSTLGQKAESHCGAPRSSGTSHLVPVEAFQSKLLALATFCVRLEKRGIGESEERGNPTFLANLGLLEGQETDGDDEGADQEARACDVGMLPTQTAPCGTSGETADEGHLGVRRTAERDQDQSKTRVPVLPLDRCRVDKSSLRGEEDGAERHPEMVTAWTLAYVYLP